MPLDSPTLRLEDTLCSSQSILNAQITVFERAEPSLLPKYKGRQALIVLGKFTDDRKHHKYVGNSDLELMTLGDKILEIHPSTEFYLTPIGYRDQIISHM